MRNAIRRFLPLALALALAVPVTGQVFTTQVESHWLAHSWDLDGEGADVDQVISVNQLVDNGTSVGGADYTILAQPDTCRLVDVTIVDADSSITAGVVTIVGTDCWGDALTTTFTFAAGGSASYPLVVTNGLASGAYYRTITTVTTGVLTGEGGAADTLSVGYSAGPPMQYPMYGVRRDRFQQLGVLPIGVNPNRIVELGGSKLVPILITTGTPGIADTDLVAVTATEGPFTNMAVGDIIILRAGNVKIERKIVTWTDADTIVVNDTVNLPAAGVTFQWKPFWVFADPMDGWIPLGSYTAAAFLFDVDANVSTGGVISNVECAVLGPTYEAVQVDTATVASTAVGDDLTQIDIWDAVFTHCRFGVSFVTNDDADAVDEDVNVSVGLRK